MNDYKLILHPKAPHAAPPTAEALVERLRASGLAGEGFPFRGDEHLLPGGEFMKLITFLGCSPAVAFEPPADGSERDGADFCHIELRGPFDTVRFLGEAGVKRPRCPRCRAWIDDWETALAAWRDDPDYRHPCPGCHEPIAPEAMNWRHSAAFGRIAVAVWGVFEGEAVPGAELMKALQELTGGEWDYFYTRAA